jgi:hypothetical protein
VVIGGADEGMEMGNSTWAENWAYNYCRFFPEFSTHHAEHLRD